MRVIRQTYADGSTSGLLKMHDDGSTRPLPEDDPSYLAWLAAGSVVEILPYVAPDLASLQAAAVQQIDAQAEAARLLVLTPGAGQMAAYQAKEIQAQAFFEDAAPTEAAYPDIYNEVGITADTAAGVANAVMQAAAAWRVYGRQIERVRLAAKKQIAEAASADAVAAILAGVVWPAA